MNNRSILIVDDEVSILDTFSIFFESLDFNVYVADNYEKAIKIIKTKKLNVIITDLRLENKKSGLDILSFSKKYDDSVQVILITAYASKETAFEATKRGIYDYIIKPVNMDTLNIITERAIQKNSLLNNIRDLEIDDDNDVDYIIGVSAKIKEIINISKKVAKSNVSVLITGESGTGKELIAKLIHESSNRKNKPFLPLNCSALPENLIESELFGYNKGAFTGANKNKDGIFIAANNGTVFLDEIGELPLQVQPKLLRVLQNQYVKKVGSNFETKVNVRIISATNRELRKDIDENKFRVDLFYRLNVININLPPLRERIEDIIPLTNYFIEKFSTKFDIKIKGITSELKDYLLGYRWPGNIRELENLIEKLITLENNDYLTTKYIENNNIVSENTSIVETMKDKNIDEIILPVELDKIVEEIEKKYIKIALNKTNGKKQEAAKLLGITFRSMRYRISKYKLEKE